MSRVLAEGTLRYVGSRDGSYDVDWFTARVFVIEYEPPNGFGGDAHVTVVARESLYLPSHRVPAPIGSIHRLPATMGDAQEGEPVKELLTLDMDALVPA